MSNNLSKNTRKILKETVTLDKAKLNLSYVIVDCGRRDKLRDRFAELGFVEGATVAVIKKAPLGDPLEVRVMNYRVCARASELRRFTVRQTDE